MGKVSILPGILTSVMLLTVAPAHAAQRSQPLQVTVDANSIWVRAGPSPVLQYRYGDVPFKPYVKELFTPAGVNVLLDAPSDHLHHHALMFACAVNNVDFWGEAVGPPDGHFEAQPGKQRHLSFDRVAVGGPEGYHLGRFGDLVPWTSGANEKPRLIETRTITAGQVGTPKATVLTWESVLAPPSSNEAPVLSGSHYHGLGLRFIRSMDATGEFRNPDNDAGVVFRGEERLARSRWCAYTAQADRKIVTVAMFDHPGNPRHPATWFIMAKPFAYMSATLRLHEEPLKLVSGTLLVLRYGVALWDGRPEMEEIEALYRKWAEMAITVWPTYLSR